MFRMTFKLYVQTISRPYLWTLTFNGVVLYVYLRMSAFICAIKKAYGNQLLSIPSFCNMGGHEYILQKPT